MPKGTPRKRPSDQPSKSDGARSGIDPINERLQRLEEHAGFSEHTVEQLSQEIAALNKSLTKLERQLERLETRVEALSRPEEGEPEGPAGRR